MIRNFLDAWNRDKDIRFYSVLVFVVYCLIYLPIPLSGKMYIYADIGSDTYSSYWPLYAFLWDYLHAPTLTQWSFQMGLGNSVASSITLLLDPYNVFLFLFKKSNIDVGIFLAHTAKVFSLSMLAFLYFRRMGYKGTPLITASLAYTFCGYFVGWGQHYHFATMFIFFTLILLSMEIWMQTGRWVLVLLSVALMALFSVPYLLMALVFLSVYYVFRYIQLNGFSLQRFIRQGFMATALILSGILLSAFSVLPQVYILDQSPRVSGLLFPKIALAPVNEYVTIFTRLLSNNLLNVNSYLGFSNFYESPFLYTSILTLVMALPLLFLKNKYYLWAFFTVFFCLAFPSVFNPLFGGLSIYIYRWTFVLVPVMTNGLASGIAGLGRIATKKAGFGALALNVSMMLTYVIYLITSVDFQKLEKTTLLSSLGVTVFFTIYTVVLIVDKLLIEALQRFLLGILVLELSFMGFVTVNLRGLLPVSAKSEIIPYFDISTRAALKRIGEQDNGFYRIDKRYDYTYLTDSLYQKFRGEKYYSSTLPVQIWELQNLFGMCCFQSNYFYGFSDNQSLRDISSVKYLLARENHFYTGYEFLTQSGRVKVYRNENALPIAFVYDRYMLLSDFKELDAAVREDIFYETVILPDGVHGVSDLETYQPSDGEEFFSEIKFVPSLPENTVALPAGMITLEPVEGKPQLDVALSRKPVNSIAVSFSVQSTVRGIVEVYFKTEGNEYHDNDKEILDILPASNQEYFVTIPVKGVDGVRLVFPNTQQAVMVSDFYILERDDKSIEQKVSMLRSNAESVGLEFISEDFIRGKIKLDRPGLLYFSIPYDVGWKLSVDGEPVETVRSNIAFISAVIGPGEHHFELKYSTPFLYEGVIVSCFALISISLVALYISVSRRK